MKSKLTEFMQTTLQYVQQKLNNEEQIDKEDYLQILERLQNKIEKEILSIKNLVKEVENETV